MIPKQFGNEHPSIVPYSVVPCSDGHFILAIGNDRQFAEFAKFAGKPEWAEDDRFKTNPARVRNRVECYRADPRGDVAEAAGTLGRGLTELDVPCGPVNDMKQVFEDPQVLARGMKIDDAASARPARARSI